MVRFVTRLSEPNQIELTENACESGARQSFESALVFEKWIDSASLNCASEAGFVFEQQVIFSLCLRVHSAAPRALPEKPSRDRSGKSEARVCVRGRGRERESMCACVCVCVCVCVCM